MKKLKSVLVSLFVLLLAVAASVNAKTPQSLPAFAGEGGVEVSAQSAVLYEADSLQVLFAHNAGERLPMASTTKIMTALLVLEKGGLDEKVTITEASVGVEGSSMYLKAGESYTRKELLYGLMLESGNDAATALALATDGTLEGFTERMNAKARELGLANTHFKNPHGLSAEGHCTTAYELARLTGYALTVDGFEELCSAKAAVLDGDGHGKKYLFNHNKLLKCYEGMIGVKTGYTLAAGRCLVTAARRNGMTLVAVTLNDRNDWHDHTAMLDYGFAAYRKVKACEKGETAAIPVSGGKQMSVRAYVARTVYLCIPTDAEFTRVFDNSRVDAPVRAGDAVAKLRFYENGTPIGEADLIAAATVNRQ